MKNKKIVFSEGHGSGIEYNRGGVLFNEGDKNFDFGRKIVSYLNKKYDVDVSGIRQVKGNIDHDLKTRREFGSDADLFYSIHTNAFDKKVSGVEVFLSYQSLEYYEFAKKLTEKISKILGIENRGVKFKRYSMENDTIDTANSQYANYFGELRGNKAKCSVLVEHCFHDNIEDARKYVKYFDFLIQEIGDLIGGYFNLPLKNLEIKNNENNNFYRVCVGAYADYKNAIVKQKELNKLKIDSYIVKVGDDEIN